jgi:hypothetical protein
MQITLLPHELDYLKMLVAGAEPTLFSEAIASKLDNPAIYAPTVSARKSDPGTSKLAGASVAMRAGSQKHLLLQAYADLTAGLTDEEAGMNSGLARKPKCCYWKRCSELRQAGFIAPIGLTRASSVGEQQQVCAITEDGLKMLEQSRG